jgi:hypothetical protein
MDDNMLRRVVVCRFTGAAALETTKESTQTGNVYGE